MISFTKRFDDNSTRAGFMFTFYCDVSNEPLQSTFIESKSDKKADEIKNAGRVIGVIENVVQNKLVKNLLETEGLDNVDNVMNKTSDLTNEFSQKFGEHSSGYLKEKENAFKYAQEEVKKYCNFCSVCNRWACIHCWSPSKQRCVEDVNSLVCPNGHKNPKGTKFCMQCRFQFFLICKNKHKNPAGTKYCRVCGEPLS